MRSTRFRLPIAKRLTLWYGLSMLLFLILFAVMLATTMHFNQHLVLHQRLFKAQTDVLNHLQVDEADVPSFQPLLAEMQGTFRMSGALGLYVRLLSPEGVVLDQSRNFEQQPFLPPLLPDTPSITEHDHRWQDVALRTMYVPLWHEDTLVGWLEASAFALEITHHITGFPLFLSILLTMLLALVGGYILSQRALKPVARLTEAAHDITASDLSVRLSNAGRVQDELTDLAETFNAMLSRLEAAFDRERRFTANAAHELMNPLAAIINEAEVGLRRPRAVATYQEALGAIQADAQRLALMLEQLLLLARMETEPGTMDATMHLSEICADRLSYWQRRAPEHTLQGTITPEVWLSGHAAHFSSLIDNLLDNAIKYTMPTGTIHLTLTLSTSQIHLTVADNGVGFVPEQASHLFDRFYRSDDPTVQAVTGSGLGLSLVQVIAQRYGGHCSAESAGPQQGSLFTVTWPLTLKAEAPESAEHHP